MKEYIAERALEVAQYIIDSKSTVRQAAKHFKVSKSTIHKDITDRLSKINPHLRSEVEEVLEYHKSIRHILGGNATREKHLRLKNEVSN